MIDPARWGVDVGYHDASGAWRQPSDGVIADVLESMGARPDVDPYAGAPILTVRLDHQLPPVAPGTLTLEDGSSVWTDGRLPADLPAGYHLLQPDIDVAPIPLVASPGCCPAAASSQWGWAAQLYATRSRDSWGIGDLADLRGLVAWSKGLGAAITLINPLHAGAPGAQQQASPYFASSRCFANPLYLRIEDIPGADIDGLEELAAAGRALDAERLIDRDRVWALKSAALEAIFARFGGDPAFDRFCSDRGAALTGYATWCALAEIHGLPWQGWPADLRLPDGPAVREFSAGGEGPRRIRYHQWLQWQLDRQLEVAAAEGALMQDLAIGVDSGGADAWMFQGTFATGMRIGAPPDEFNTLGQDWGLPPWDPWKLRQDGYRPFIETVRAGLRHAGGLRFDHVMGLFRLYWIPGERTAAEGTYVRYPYWDLLNILALEAHRAGAFVVGEDLGTVEDRVREELRSREVLSYRLLWFEPGPPRTWPERALGAVSTHDLPTVAGVWNGSDLEAQRRLDLSPNEDGSEAMRARLREATGSDEATPAEAVVDGAYRLLAEAPCAVLTATLDDALAVEERPNMPGTTSGWPNWSLALPVPLEVIETAPLALRIAEHLGRRTASPGDG